MATAKSELQLIISARDDASKKIKNLGGTVGTTQKQFAGIKIAAGIAAGAILAFAKSSINAAAAQQKEEARLAAALANVKNARKEDFYALTEQASALQQVTAYADEQIISAQSMLATFQLNGDAIKELTPRILDMGAAIEKNTGQQVDLQQIAIAVGKGMTGMAGILTRYGVTMSDTQKKQLDMAKGMDKVAKLTEILDENFHDIAEGTAKTFSGRLSILKNNIDEVKEGIGFQLLPTLELLIGSLNTNAKGLQENVNDSNTLGRAFYSLANIAKGLVYGILAIGEGLVNLSMISYKTAQSFYAMGKDLLNVFRNIKEAGVIVFTAVGKAIRGDFVGAGRDFLKLMPETLGAINSFAVQMEVNAGMVNKFWNEAVNAFNEAWTQEGFVPVQRDLSDLIGGNNSFSELGDEMEETGGKGKEAMKETAEAIQENNERLQDFITSAETLKEKQAEIWSSLEEKLDKFKDKLKEAKNSFKESFQGIVDELREVRENFKQAADDIYKNFDESFRNLARTYDQKIAKEIIDAEENKTKAQIELNEELSKAEEDRNEEKIKQLQTTINEESGFLENHKQDYIDYEEAIAEERKIRSMDAVELLKYQFQQEKIELQKDRDEKLEILKQETSDKQQELLEQLKIVQEIYDKIQETIHEKMHKARVKARNALNKILDDTKEIVDLMKKEFKEIPDEIEEAFDEIIKKIKNKKKEISGIAVEKETINKDKNSGGGISVSFNNVNVRSENDLNTIVDTVKRTLSRDLIKQQLGT